MSLLLISFLLLITAEKDGIRGMQSIEKEPFLLFYDTTRTLAEHLLLSALKAKKDIEDRTSLSISRNVSIVVSNNKKRYRSLVARRRGGEKFGVGVAFTGRSLILIDASSEHAVFQPASAILRHELFHIALAEFIQKERVTVPLWFNEGVAQLFEQRYLNNLERQDLATLARSGGIPPFYEFASDYPEDENMRRILYLASVDFLRYITNDDPRRLRPFFRNLKTKHSFDEAFRATFGAPVETLQLAWQKSLSKEYSFWLQVLQRTGMYLVFAVLIIVLVVVYFVRRKKALRQLDELEP